jgi:hypothetical protein
MCEQAEMERQGARAAARGGSRESNPMFDWFDQADATGKGDKVWSGRRDL